MVEFGEPSTSPIDPKALDALMRQITSFVVVNKQARNHLRLGKMEELLTSLQSMHKLDIPEDLQAYMVNNFSEGYAPRDFVKRAGLSMVNLNTR